MRLHAPSLALALALSSSSLHAQDVTARRRAMIDQAASLSRAGDHRQAIELLTRAGSLRMTPGLRMVLAQEQRLADRTADAFADGHAADLAARRARGHHRSGCRRRRRR